MGKKTKQLEDILNVGIGAVKTSQEVWEKLMVDLNTKKEDLTQTFEKLRQAGEKDFSEEAIKVKLGAAWGIVRFDEIKDNIIHFLEQNNPNNASASKDSSSKVPQPDSKTQPPPPTNE